MNDIFLENYPNFEIFFAVFLENLTVIEAWKLWIVLIMKHRDVYQRDTSGELLEIKSELHFLGGIGPLCAPIWSKFCIMKHWVKIMEVDFDSVIVLIRTVDDEYILVPWTVWMIGVPVVLGTFGTVDRYI